MHYYCMGSVLDMLIGNSDTLDESEYKSFDHSQTDFNTNASLSVSVGEVETKSDMLRVEEAILSGQIVIIDVSNLGNGLSKDDIVNFLSEAVEGSEGDISWRSNKRNELILTPSGVDINRERI